ncbi:peptidase M16 [Chromatium okenii]|uniref:M16 family metallopeptidase n=1 Tax=Chromatium okenii TaxID=61644 RepID=UPI001908778F|nr:pitrilysin family protein [Chromatium okenii]MBK1640449.1 peptidase M16 [Chromatium okenii]
MLQMPRPLTLFAQALIAATLVLTTAPAAAVPEIQTWQTPTGARVLFVAAPEIPMVDVSIVFDAGSARDGTQAGLAAVTAKMLMQGAGSWDADALAERTAVIGAAISVETDRDLTSIGLRSLTQQPALETALETLTAVVTTPTFPAADWERVRKNWLIGLRQAEESPKSVAQKALNRAIFGDHPYAADPAGTAATIAALTREELQAFHARYYHARNAVVAIVGALDRAEAEAMATRLTAGLPSGERAAALPPVAELTSGAVTTLPFPATQTTVLLGQPGMRRGDPDYFPLYVGNHILGGSGLVSLLMNEIREQRGLSYSVSSAFSPLAQLGSFTLGLQTKTAQASQARAVLLETLQRFIATGPTEAQLTAAKQNLTGGFPLRIASNSSLINYLEVIGFYHLPLDYLAQFRARVEAVTVEQIREAFARRIHPERLAVVLVGEVARE